MFAIFDACHPAVTFIMLDERAKKLDGFLKASRRNQAMLSASASPYWHSEGLESPCETQGHVYSAIKT